MVKGRPWRGSGRGLVEAQAALNSELGLGLDRDLSQDLNEVVPDPASTPGEVTFILELGRALIHTGTPTHRFENTLVDVTRKLGVEAQFFALPTGFFAFVGPQNDQHTYFLRGSLGDANLGKISSLHDIVKDVLEDRLDPATATARVKAVVAATTPHAAWLLLTAHALSAGIFAVFFGGGWREGLLALIPGFCLGLMVLFIVKHHRTMRVLPVLGAIQAGLLGVFLSHMVGNCNAWIILVGGIGFLLPGLSIVIAMNELATGHLLSGTARSMAALMSLLQLAFGFVVARQLGNFGFQDGMYAVSLPLPDHAKWVLLFVMAPVMLVLFHAKWRYLPVIMVGCVLSFGGSRLGSAVLGPEIGAGIGAYLLGVGCNLYARWFNGPSFVPLTPGLLLLVPGSMGVNSLRFLAERQIVSGIELATTMLFVATSLLVGLLLSRVTVSPRKSL